MDLSSYPASLDPGLQYDTESYSVYRNIFDQLLHPFANLVTGRANRVDGLILRIGQVPVDVLLARDVGAGIAAAHRDDYVGAAGELVAEALWSAVREVDAQFLHHIDDRRVNPPVGIGFAAGGVSGVPSFRRVLEQRLAHLRPPGVVKADEEHACHGLRVTQAVERGRQWLPPLNESLLGGQAGAGAAAGVSMDLPSQ